jgi:hypothetical protein
LGFVKIGVFCLLCSFFLYISGSLKIIIMVLVVLKIKCRVEELPVLGGFVLSSMQGSLADFTAFSPDYNAGFVTTANADMAVIEGLINPKMLTKELKVITKRIYTNQGILRSKIDFLEGYINRANGLTMDKKDFGISEVRTKNNMGDIEGLGGALNFLLTNVNVATNLTAITAKGYTTAQNTALVNLRDGFRNDNLAQNTKINDRNNKMIANYGKLNAFWDKIMDVADAGKRIYKATAPNRLDDFTMAKLKARIRQERNNTRFEGVVMSGGVALKGASIELKPLGGGRRRVTKSKLNGSFVITSMEAGDYSVMVSATGKTSVSDEILIVTNVPLQMDFVLA